mmetsp:Transcript_85956/g.179709  ORF Transcript_85956/g.179709 Transcript_85956/m.179709 type:complete len:403 (-) Transcript_85956:37-1245(-)|eukprot:CAMPEP_0206449270 /NCGR_PEP_ID=MMETSP0324_2-20121206/17988_1 /ASSEMBLY_ACC=CAM_ASM_000836 /TAXON_ID=2866 /ORGANISM="Crypthecodinium cohnii, Strain Seligo" /LENGTH=402 /DNA_ID=CAMNT_0053918613 /DNA_START=407 /DNA_END=1615 /DNA_ORIENTATION=-
MEVGLLSPNRHVSNVLDSYELAEVEDVSDLPTGSVCSEEDDMDSSGSTGSRHHRSPTAARPSSSSSSSSSSSWGSLREKFRALAVVTCVACGLLLLTSKSVVSSGGGSARSALALSSAVHLQSKESVHLRGLDSDSYMQPLGPTLFCFALVTPRGKEFELMNMLLQRSMGPFSCDGYNIYSNETLALGTNPSTGLSLMTTSIGEGSLDCILGSRWATALNTEVFARVWRAVNADGQYVNYDWSLKVDADCVFVPQRLRSILIGIDPFTPAYLENCKYGLHGPIEVVNRLGMRAFLVGQHDCADIYHAAITQKPVMFSPYLHDHKPPAGVWVADSLDHGFGEDEYLRRCFEQLKVKKINAHGMLAEEACKTHVDTCTSKEVVAFHPFKDSASYLQCMHEATLE